MTFDARWSPTLLALLLVSCQASPGPSPTESAPDITELDPSTVPSSPPSSDTGATGGDAVRYVAEGGDDAGPGTSAEPWATLEHAARQARPGMTVLIRDGVYAGFVLSRSGTQEAPIRFAADDGAAPVIEEAGRQFLVHIDGASDVVLTGLVVRGAGERDGAGIYVGPGAARVTVQSSEIRDNRSFGVLIEDSQDVVVRASEITGSGSGIRTIGGVPGTLIAANDIYDNDVMVVSDAEPDNDYGAQGIALVTSTGPITVRANRIWGNRAESVDYGRDGAAIEVFGATDVLITENVMWDNETVMETGTNRTSECVDVRFVRNVAYADTSWGVSKGLLLRCARDSLFAHNTLLGLEEWAFQFRNRPGSLFGGSIENLVVVNNVISSDVAFYLRDPLPESVVVDYNLVDADVGVLGRVGDTIVPSLAEFRSLTGEQASGAHARLDLVDPEDGDFRPQPSSPALDRGLTIPGVNDDYSGSAPDIGRYERPGP